MVRLIAAGSTDLVVAALRHMSPHTVRHHVASAMRKVHAQSRTELVAKCFASGLLKNVWPPTLANPATCLCGVIDLAWPGRCAADA